MLLPHISALALVAFSMSAANVRQSSRTCSRSCDAMKSSTDFPVGLVLGSELLATHRSAHTPA
jgi:hypothetical protein